MGVIVRMPCSGKVEKRGEEGGEVAIATVSEPDDRLVSEVADLWFHSLVALEHYGLGPADVLAELSRGIKAS